MRSGFTLVEMMVVLVIIGLLVGGITLGTNLIRNAELKNIVTDLSKFRQAVDVFQDKNLSLPGDFPFATDRWERQVSAAHCVTNSAATVATPGACDGDGNGLVDAAGGSGQSGETYQFWRHLVLSDLLEGGFSGLAGGGGANDAEAGSNVPQGAISGTGWHMEYLSGGSTERFDVQYGNAFVIGRETANRTDGAFLEAEEAFAIDTKQDDGEPGTGRVIARFWNTCTTAANNGDTANAQYALQDKTEQCALYFLNEF